MNSFHPLLLSFSVLISAVPASAQLVHLALEPQDSSVIFHADSGLVPWHPAVGWITEFDIHYDARLNFGDPLDASRNYWHMHLDVPELRSFDITRPIQSISASSDSETGVSSLMFTFNRFDATHFETMELNLIFNQLIPTTGKLPLPPLPELGSTQFGQGSSVFIQGGRSYFDFPHLADFYGGAGIRSISFRIQPVPEPAYYALTATLLLAAVAIARKRFQRVVARATRAAAGFSLNSHHSTLN